MENKNMRLRIGALAWTIVGVAYVCFAAGLVDAGKLSVFQATIGGGILLVVALTAISTVETLKNPRSHGQQSAREEYKPTPPDTITPEVHERLVQWQEEGKPIYWGICSNLGCLRDFFTTTKKPAMCPSGCGCPVNTDYFVEVSPDDFEVEEPVIIDVTPDDLEVYVDWKGTVLLDIGGEHGHWRPIKIAHMPADPDDEMGFWQDTYHQMRYGDVVPENEAEEMMQQIEQGTFVEEYFDWMAHIVEHFGYRLVQPEDAAVAQAAGGSP